MPKITIILTTYNLETYIEKCLSQLFSQTFQDFNVVIVDDCSNDRTVKKIKPFMEKYNSRIQTIFLKENMGSPAKTRNIALDSDLVDGEYVIFLDGDDSINPDFLEKLYFCAKDTNSEIAFCAYDRIDIETGRVLSVEMRNFPSEIYLPPKNDILSFINTSLWNKIIKNSIIGEDRIPDYKVGEDLSLLHTLYRKCTKISSVNEVLIHYQVRSESVISNTQQETIYKFADEFVRHKNSVSNSYYKQTIALTAFIHIGISMAIRAYDNKSINTKKHLQWTRQYFIDNFDFFREYSFLSFSSLIKHGIKGLAIWLCKILYKARLPKIFLILYRIVIRTLKVDFKF